MGLGPTDFSLGIDFLQSQAKGAHFPLLVSNLKQELGSKKWSKRFVVLNKAGLKIGFISLLPQDAFIRLGAMRLLLSRSGVKIISPAVALGRLIPKLKSQVDLLVLISWLSGKQTRELVNRLPGVDVVFLLGRFKGGLSGDYFQDGQPMFIRAYPRGEAVGYIHLSWEGQRPVVEDLDLILLNSQVPEEKGVQAMLEGPLQAAEEMRKLGNRQKQRQKVLKMSPEQFLQWQQREGVSLQ